MRSKINLFLWLGAATSFIFCGSVLNGFTLVIDTWRVSSITTNNVTITYHQGILKECIKNGTKLQCYTWTKSVSFDELIGFQELLLYLIVASSAVGGLSILLSVAAMTSRLPRFVIPVTASELVSALLGITSLIIYTARFVKEPWRPGFSYFCLWGGTILIILGLIIHTWIRDVKFVGKKCFVEPLPNYRYHKASNTITEM